MKKWLYNLIALGIGIFVSLLLAEIVLRIYNPFQSRIRGNEIVLPAKVTYEFKRVNIPGLNNHIIHSKNSLGFRGPELNTANNKVKIICIGGSTTECFYLNDGQDWPAIMQNKLSTSGHDVWINNAGLDGHSTRGHLILLRDHVLKYKPKIIIFLVGCNDVAGDGLNDYEQYHLQNKKRFLENFEIFNAWLSWRRSRAARNMGLGHKPIDFKNCEKKDTSYWANILKEYLPNSTKHNRIISYSQRLDSLANLCFKAGITPVFVTQPTMLGGGIDPVSNRYLGDLKFQTYSGLQYRAILDMYNSKTLEMEKKHPGKCFVIDAAIALQSSSENYYDFFHYTINGATEMASIIGNELIKKGVLR